MEELETIPVRVNGDELQFATDEEGYRRWIGCLDIFGFDRSPGKNLVSRKFCTINTTMFRTPEGRPSELVDYANVGLLTHTAKVNGRVSNFLPFWDIHNMIEPGFKNKNLFTKLFLHYYQRDIEMASSKGKFNLYIPRSRGGCGLRGKGGYITPFQRALATYLARRDTHYGKISLSEVGVIGKSVHTGLAHLPHTKEPYGRRITTIGPLENGWKELPEPKTVGEYLSGILDDTVLYRRLPMGSLDLPIFSLMSDDEIYAEPDSLRIITRTILHTSTLHSTEGDSLVSDMGAHFNPQTDDMEIDYFQTEPVDQEVQDEKEEGVKEPLLPLIPDLNPLPMFPTICPLSISLSPSTL
jgi:hypothetical protein